MPILSIQNKETELMYINNADVARESTQEKITEKWSKEITV